MTVWKDKLTFLFSIGSIVGLCGCFDNSIVPRVELPTDEETESSGSSDAETETSTDSDTDTHRDSETSSDWIQDTETADVCDDFACNEPQENTCDDEISLRIENSFGYCENGACQYPSHLESCETGECRDGSCLQNECHGIVCQSPDDPVCSDGELKISNQRGYCVEAACRYAKIALPCDGGCHGSKCDGEDICSHTVCNRPPARYCQGSTLVTFDAVGRCDGGDCLYAKATFDCAPGECKEGKCSDDNSCAAKKCLEKDGTDYYCGAVLCHYKPASYCLNAKVLRVYTNVASCENGACYYEPKDIECPTGCGDGQCTGFPCEGVECDSPPASYCKDSHTLVHWNLMSSCKNGACAYELAETKCELGCSGGSCVGGACDTVKCLSPPPGYCLDATTRIQFKPTGVCVTGGMCSYASEQKTCGDICLAGVCVTGR